MLMLLCFTLLLLSTFSTPLVHATIYQGHDQSSPVIYPVHHLYVVVDTSVHTISIVGKAVICLFYLFLLYVVL